MRSSPIRTATFRGPGVRLGPIKKLGFVKTFWHSIRTLFSLCGPRSPSKIGLTSKPSSYPDSRGKIAAQNVQVYRETPSELRERAIQRRLALTGANSSFLGRNHLIQPSLVRTRRSKR